VATIVPPSTQTETGPPERSALQEVLDGEHAWARDMVREVTSGPEFERAGGSIPTDEYRELVGRWTKMLAETGQTGFGYPEEYGGRNMVGPWLTAFETLAHSDLSLLVKAGVQFGLFGGAVLHLGTKKHHDRYLKDIATYDLPGCFAMTELGHGSNVQELETTATYDHEARELVVHSPTPTATKDWIGNAAQDGRMASVFCQLVVGEEESRGVHCVLVPIRDKKGRALPGVTLEDDGEKIGLNGVDNGRITFDHVRVPVDNLLDRYAQITEAGEYVSSIDNKNKRFFTMLGTLIVGRVSVCGAGIAATESALTIAVRYGTRRRQFGPPDKSFEVPLLDYRAHQRRLLPALAQTYAFHFAQNALVAETDRIFTADDDLEDDRRQLETRAAGLKAVATWHAVHTIQECREACGGKGYARENRFASLRADTDVFTTFEGDNTILLQLVAKSLLTGFRDQFEDLNQVETVRFVASQALDVVGEKSALREIAQRLTDDLIPSRENRDDLRDRDYHLGLFRWREDHMLSSAARRLQSGIGDGGDPFEVFNDCQDHVIATARAHVDREVLEAFVAGIELVEDGDTKQVLETVCDLHALSIIERDRAWFQEHGRISSTRAKAITREVNALCAELRPMAGALVDAFGIPDAVLGAPIGLREPPED
jgi:acyl-CoA oxidase